MSDIPKGARVAVYYRCSTHEQINSIADQKTIVDTIVEEKGLRVVAEYEDKGISGGTINERPQMCKLILDAKGGKFAYVLFYDVSRLSRGGAVESCTIVRELKKNRVQLYSCQDKKLVNDTTMHEFFSEADSALKSNKQRSRDITRTMINNVQLRKMDPGRTPPFGYERLYLTPEGEPIEQIRTMPDGTRQILDPKTGELRSTIPKGESFRKVKSYRVKLVPSTPERVATLQRIFRLAKTHGYSKIAEVLNTEGIPAPRSQKWSLSSIRDILLNPVYTGTIVYNRRPKSRYYTIKDQRPQEISWLDSGKLNCHRNPESEWIIIEDAHEALVSKEDFEGVQAAMAARNKCPQRTGRSKNRDYMLSGLMICKRCGSRMEGCSIPKKGGGHYFYYRCSGSNKHGKSHCARYSLPVDTLEDFVVARVRGMLLSEEGIAAMRKEIQSELARRQSLTDSRDSVTKELKSLEREKADLLEKLKRLDTSATELFQDEIHAYKAHEDALKARLETMDAVLDAAQTEALLDKAVQEIQRRLEESDKLSGAAMKDLLCAVGTQMTYDPDTEEGCLWFDPFGQSVRN